MDKKTVVFEPDGFLANPYVHDGLLYGIRVDGRRKLRIYIELIDKSCVVLLFGNLVLLKADNFREGNIIFSVSYREFIRSNIVEQKTAWKVKFDNDAVTPGIMDKHAILIVKTSYGCDLVGIFDRMMEVELIER